MMMRMATAHRLPLPAAVRSFSLAAEKVLQNADSTQIELMEERCILLDGADNVIGHESKLNCHLMDNKPSPADLGPPLHRAFSVFLFNSKNEMLLQRRAAEKILFPLCWTNTCCSHPLHTDKELGLLDNDDPIVGVKHAAIRKLEQELGIKPEDLPIDDFHFMTRVKYHARCTEDFGEHEIDYVLLIQADVELDNVNPNEIVETMYIDQAGLKEMFATLEEKDLEFSPWGKLICDQFMDKWWPDVPTPDRLVQHRDDKIHSYGTVPYPVPADWKPTIVSSE
jgi:isopentenyl-diphosphate delta-isomerase